MLQDILTFFILKEFMVLQEISWFLSVRNT